MSWGRLYDKFLAASLAAVAVHGFAKAFGIW